MNNSKQADLGSCAAPSGNREIRDERGSALFIVVLFMVAIAIFGNLVNLSSINESRLAQRFLYSTQSLWIADAGMQRTAWEIASNDCKGMQNAGTLAYCISCASCGSGKRKIRQSLGAGEYVVEVDSTLASAVSRGYYPSEGTPKLRRYVYADLNSSNQIFGYGAFGSGSVLFKNTATVDAYDSSLGAYGVGGNSLKAGNVGTNGTQSGAITFSNTVHVYGSASTGPNGTVVRQNGGNIDGGTPSTNNVTLPSVTVPASLKGLTSAGSITLNNTGTVTLGTTGTQMNYKYDKFTFKNTATINVNGDVNLYITDPSVAIAASNTLTINVASGSSFNLYVDGALSFANTVALNNVAKLPTKFGIYSTYDSSAHANANGITWSNSGDMYGTMYAPKANIEFKNTVNFYGAISGNSLTMDNTANIHYDSALGSVSLPGTSSKPRNWQEVTN